MSIKSNFKGTDFPYKVEQMRLTSKGKYQGRFNVIQGTEENIHVFFSPSANISGYGKTRAEAKKDFDYNVQIFFEDLFAMTASQRKSFLINLGWIEEKYANKNYSKAFVNDEGILEGLENPKIRSMEIA